jgi:hypothetical protein
MAIPNTSPSWHGPDRFDYLNHNSIVVGPPADPEEFGR